MEDIKMDLLEKIEMCDLSIAVDCNFKCKMCYFWKNNQSQDIILDNDSWKNVIDQVSCLFNKDIKLIFSGGGEILLRPGIEELLNYAGDKFDLSLNTNGYLIDRSRAKLLSRTVKNINISLDGISALTHDDIRGMPGSFERVLKAIEYLREESQDMIIIINTVILAQNLDEIVRMVEWVDDNQINGIIFQAVSAPNNIPYDCYWYKNEFKFLWPQDTNKIQTVINKLIKCKKKGSKIINSLKQLECFRNYFINPESSIESLSCEVDRVVRIDRCGNIKMCDFSQSIGNVQTEKLKDILSSDLAQKERTKAYECKSPCHLLVNCFHDNGG